MREEKTWNGEAIELLKIMGEMFANALEHRRSQEAIKESLAALREALSEVERLKNRLQVENIYLREEIKTEHNFEEIVGQSEPLKELLRNVEQVARTNTTVLIQGETGTGKELIARAIHSLSSRKDRPLVKVNCGAISEGLVESELFGHEKGAFTGASQRRIGRFELADGGTIFLDEVAELPPDSQTKLLHVLQEGEFERVGSSKPIKVDVRIIAATNRDLENSFKEGLFRSDLFYRLNVFPLYVPPLRERKSDIAHLVNFFLTKFGKKLGKEFHNISNETMERLMNYLWPGNIRELQNVIERAAVLSQKPEIQIDVREPLRPLDHSTEIMAQDLEHTYRQGSEQGQVPRSASSANASVEIPNGEFFMESSVGSQIPGSEALEDMERVHILRVLECTNWVIEGNRGAAAILSINPSTLRSRMRKLGIKKLRIRN